MPLRTFTATEYRFVVPGRAFSFRTSRGQAYKKTVRGEARRVFPKPIAGQPVEVRIDCFHWKPLRADIDNIAKCIIDALIGVAYVDDSQVVHQSAVGHWLQEEVHMPGGPIDLVKPLAQHLEYAFVRVRLSPLLRQTAVSR